MWTELVRLLSVLMFSCSSTTVFVKNENKGTEGS
jgi:hypothetical protein